MEREEIDRLMAEHLGREITDEDDASLRAEMIRDPDLAAEVKALARTLETLRFAEPGKASASGPSSPRPGSSSPERRTRHGGWPAALRYAAAMVLAFFAGYVSYSVIHGTESATGSMKETIVAATEPTEESESHPRWEDTFAAMYTEQQGHSPLARSWIAYSRTMQD